MLFERLHDSLLRNTEANPLEHFKVITIRSGKKVEMRKEIVMEKEKVPVIDVFEVSIKEGGTTLTLEKSVLQMVKGYVLRLPYPSKLKSEHTDKQFKRFLELVKQLHINMPFEEALFQILKYRKFLKDLLTTKRKFEEVSTATSSEGSSTPLQNRMSKKMKDLESFTIPYNIDKLVNEETLAYYEC